MGKHYSGGGTEIVDGFKYSGQRFLDLRKECQSISELKATDETSIPDGFTKYVHDTDTWYRYHSDNEELADTGRWRSILHGREVLGGDFIYAITDNAGNLLWGLRFDGSAYQPKGIPEEVQARFSELAGWQITDSDTWLLGVVDCLGNLLFGLDRKGKAVLSSGLTLGFGHEDSHDTAFELTEDENYLFAITDREGTLLFGLDRKGAVVSNKGMSDEVRARFKELDGIKPLHSDNWLFALTDASDRLLVGIDPKGKVVVPKGIIEVVSWEEYQQKPTDDNVLYLIEGDAGVLQTAYYKGRALQSGEEYNFLCEGNVLMYRGHMSVLPRIGINHEEMTLEVEYPTNYEGPLFENVDGLLVLR